ncbi:cysteine desulfurase family protein [Lactococcus kimchii]|uniref:cysteine desulfurase family protein n=1 Tax=Lactococcus sp. S-13 TaxID=2507158 RepID=UPI001023268B|nr:cysteine desulfurase family protein [Lactococcus sp. S-13]RZI49051.1 cysteine desulfurase [Lactococcus sp. S-13]
MIYFDNAATTPLLADVITAMTESLSSNFGNPSSIHGLGRQASQIVRQARETVAKALAVPSRNIIFTSGASEANNQALIGYALANRDKGNHILTTAIEHPSVLNTVHYLHERYGFDISFIKPHADGQFTPELIEEHLRPDTILVSMMWANNETGQLLPVAEIGQLLVNHQAAYHVDATQVMGKIPVHPLDIGADFLSAAAHKFHGPKGVGFLYYNENLHFDALIHGGEQEEKRRAGTENLHSLVGLAKALETALENMDENFAHVQKLNAHLLDLLKALPFYKNEFGPSMPHVLNLAFPNENHDLLLTKLDLAGFAISTGSACTAGTIEPSHVLEAVYGKNSPKLKENIRVSFSELNTFEEVNRFANQLISILKK